MRIGFHLEDESDKTVIKAFIRRITGEEVNLPPTLDPEEDDVRTGRRRFSGGPLRFTGDSYVFAQVNTAARDFHARYFRGVVIGVDNDEKTPRHESEHEDRQVEFSAAGCRFCRIRRSIPSSFNPRTQLVDPFIAVVSVPVEMIEAWVLFGRGYGNPESIHKRELKPMLYGTSSPSRSQIEDTCVPIVESMDIPGLEEASPSFAFFAGQIRFFVEAHGANLQNAPY